MELDISKCEFSESVEGSIRIAIERFGGGGSALRTMQPLGLIARPRDPEEGVEGASGDGANALYLDLGGEGFVMPLLDPRFTAKVPPVKKGGVALYSAPGGTLNFDGDDGTLLVLTPATNGASHVLAFDNPNDAIQLRHAQGHGLAMLGTGTKPIVLNNVAGNVCVMLDDNGVVISGDTQCVGSLVIGQIPSAQDVALAPAYQDLLTLTVSLIGKLAVAPAVAGVVTPTETTALGALLTLASTLGRSTILKASPGPT